VTERESGGRVRLKVAFAGTPDFARVALQAIAAAGYAVPLVLSQPDRPAGRGLKLQASPVKLLALEQGWPVAQPRSLRLDGKFPEDAAAARMALEDAAPDVLVVAAYGLILPAWVLALPRLGCLNIHASLLPRPSTMPLRSVTRRPASPSCRWTLVSTPGRCSSASPSRSGRTTAPAHCTTAWPRWAAG
jgi:Formyl transferase